MKTNTGKRGIAVIGTAVALIFAVSNGIPGKAAELDGSGYPRLATISDNTGVSFGGYYSTPSTTPAWNGYAEPLGGAWNRSWLGDYAQMEGTWIWHNCHAFLWIVPGSTIESTWMFSNTDQNWYWTNWELYGIGYYGPTPGVPQTNCTLYSVADGAWLFYLPDTTNPRWFYNFSTGQWFSRP